MNGGVMSIVTKLRGKLADNSSTNNFKTRFATQLGKGLVKEDGILVAFS